MFYAIDIKDHIRVPPNLFDLPIEEAITKRIRKKYEGYIDKEIGIAIDVPAVYDIREGIIIPGDGASYYETKFKLITFKPELQEVVLGKIKDIADFGAFLTIGPTEGMIHISQTMDDFVSFAKDKTLAGKESKKTLKVTDNCRARIIAVSYKQVSNPKIGLTMRQPFLGRLDWVSDEEKPKEEKKAKDDKKEPKEKAKDKKKKKK